MCIACKPIVEWERETEMEYVCIYIDVYAYLSLASWHGDEWKVRGKRGESPKEEEEEERQEDVKMIRWEEGRDHAEGDEMREREREMDTLLEEKIANLQVGMYIRGRETISEWEKVWRMVDASPHQITYLQNILHSTSMQIIYTITNTLFFYVKDLMVESERVTEWSGGAWFLCL